MPLAKSSVPSLTQVSSYDTVGAYHPRYTLGQVQSVSRLYIQCHQCRRNFVIGDADLSDCLF